MADELTGSEKVKQKWLDQIANDLDTVEADYAAAEAVLRDDRLAGEQVDVSRLITLGYVIANTNGTYAAVFPMR